MSMYSGSDYLAAMSGEVMAVKRNTNRTQVEKDINARIRQLIDMRPFWSGLLKRTVLNCPNSYTTGGVSLNPLSRVIIGTGTAWPYNDLVGTTFTAGLQQTGYQEITPASMNGIVTDAYLYIADSTSGGAYSEVVQVTDVTQTTFTANFQNQHDALTPIWRSSLSGMQLNLGQNYPIFTLTAVTNQAGTAGLIDTPFGGLAVMDSGYTLLQAYFTIDPFIKDIFQVWDTVQGIPLGFHKTQNELNQLDPQRTSMGNPQALFDFVPTISGSMQYELWPYQYTNYQIAVLYAQQWPQLTRQTDKAPWFINPRVIVDGATADALRRLDLKNSADKDPWFNPALADKFEAKYFQGALDAASADQGKAMQALQSNWFQVVGQNAQYWQSHVWGGQGLGIGGSIWGDGGW